MAGFFIIVFCLMAMHECGTTWAAVKPWSCLPNPCLHGGLCTVKSNTYDCICPPNCIGAHCETCPDDNPVETTCDPSPCKRDCVCHESCQHAGGYYCRSPSGFLGKNCTVPVPSLRCEPDRMILSVAESFVQEYDLGMRNSFIVVSRGLGQRSSCHVSAASNGFYEVEIPLPFTACGTEMSTDGKHTLFTNQMWFNRRLTSAMFDMPIPAAEFQCSYVREYRLMTSLTPVLSTPNRITSRRMIYPTISLCKVPACPNACPEKFNVRGGAVYTVAEMIHVTMTLDSGMQVTGVRNVHLSCSPEASDVDVVEVVTAGCGTTSGLPCEIRTSVASHVVCVSFQTPRAMGCSKFFIHAELMSCDQANTENCPGTPAVRRCRGSRRRRSVDAPSMTIGPILLLNATVGIPLVRIHGMEEDSTVKMSIDYNSKKPAGNSVAEVADFDVNSREKAEPSPSTEQKVPHTGVRPILLVVVVFSSLLLLAGVFALFLFWRRSAVPSK